MPAWAWILVAMGLGAAAAGAYFGARALHREYERRSILKLLVRAEAVTAVASALYDGVARLSQSSDEDIARFVADEDSDERRVLSEVKTRSMILLDELDTMALPVALVPTAEALADTAFVVAEEAQNAEDAAACPEPMAALIAVDLERMLGMAQRAQMLVKQARFEHGAQDSAVYGGGLYL